MSEEKSTVLAIGDFEKALHIDPGDVHIYRSRGNVYRQQGEYDLAVADYSSVIQITPDDEHAYHVRGPSLC